MNIEANRPPKWNKYEAALLIDTYQKIRGKKSFLNDAKELSRKLVKLGQYAKIDINSSTYRNFNGINMRLYEIRDLFGDGKGKMNHTSELFKDMVEMYNTDREEFDRILSISERMLARDPEALKLFSEKKDDQLPENEGVLESEVEKSEDKSVETGKKIEDKDNAGNEVAFYKWLERKIGSRKMALFKTYYKTIEEFAKKLNIIKKTGLFDVKDEAIAKNIQKRVEEDRLFKNQNKKDYKKIVSASRYFTQYTKENSDKEESKGETSNENHQAILGNKTIEIKEVKTDVDEISGNDNAKHYLRPEKEAFYRWLQDEKGYTESTSKGIVSAVNSAEKIAKEYLNSSYILFTFDIPTIIRTCRLLYKDSHFIELDNKQNKRLSRAIDLYCKYNNIDNTVPDKSDTPKQRIAWDIYEAVILLEGYLEINNGTQRNIIVKRVSKDLRQMALNQGKNIDEVYRNENGISYQLHGIDSAFKGYQIFVPASILFKETVDLYKNDRARYLNILSEAKRMIGDVSSDDKDINKKIADILLSHYQFGFKINSIIEMMRFRQFADSMGISLPEDDDTLKTMIIAVGNVIEGKVYYKNIELPEQLSNIVEDAFSSGAKVIYYDCLFVTRSEWMTTHLINSEIILKEYLQKYVKECSFSKRFMSRGLKLTEKDAVTAEIKRVWGEHQTESVDNLCSRLPFIPKENILRVITGNNSFVLASEGVYLLVDRFIVTENEEENILDFVSNTCRENGFASLSDVPLGDIEEQNYEVTLPTIYNAIYKRILINEYHLNGKILTKDKPELDEVLLLKQYIKGKNECTFDEVAEKVVELTGGTNRQYAFQALYDEMVRVDKNRFVSNNAVSFDINEIDRVLATFISDHFAAIRDITTFAMFPLCGHSWNHYLLESFCYKYSRKYSLHVIHFNDKNAGIIAEKDFNKNYSEMLAMELARSDIELKAEIVGTYLFNTGYMAKSKYAKLGDIVQRAKEIRKEG